MSFETVCPVEPRERWLQARKAGIGASEIGAILGLARFASPISVYAGKIEVEASEEERPFDARYWGQKIEPLVIEAFAKATGRKCEPHDILIRSVERPWQLASLDAEQHCDDYDGPGVLEIKCTSRYERWDEQIPPDVFVQVQQQLAVTGWKWGSIAVLFQGREFYRADFLRDDELIAQINAAGAEFWRRVCELEAPEADGHPATVEALKRLYPSDDGSVIDLPESFAAEDERRCQIDAAIKALQSQRAEIDNRLKAAIGEATTGRVGDVAYHWKSDKRGVRSLRRSA